MPESTGPDVATTVRALVGNGFALENVSRRPGYMLLECRRQDEFGVFVPYLFVLCESPLGDAASKAVVAEANSRRALLVAIGEGIPEAVPAVPWTTFIARLGGPVRSWLPLETSFRRHLVELGHNRSVPEIEGRPDDLFEEYVHVGLQFILANRVIRYGQERRGEPVPDGLALGTGKLLLLYDAKAYEKGYPVTLDSIRQFSDYVRKFHMKYEAYLGRLHSFLVVSGEFASGEDSLLSRYHTMIAECGVPLCFITADDLGAAVEQMARQPALRQVLNWRELFSRVQVTASDVEKAVRAAAKDGVVR